jgi:release factor glutamine methyltransferase
LGTGSGAIAVALAHECPYARITATDISPEALSIAIGNAGRNRVDDRITFIKGNLFKPVRNCLFDVIVSNPPYIDAGDYARLPVEVKNFEPREALFAGEDGMDFYKVIVPQAACYLKPGGWLLLEIGDRQKDRIESLFRKAGFYRDIAFRKDYAGRWRVATARRKEEESG